MRSQPLFHQEEHNQLHVLQKARDPGQLDNEGFVSVKTRSLTPVLANDGGGGFWLASVAAGPGAGAILSPHATHPGMETACGPSDAGFMNSQTTMADFMTTLPQMGPEGPLQHSPGAGGSMSPGNHHPGYHSMMDPHGVADPSGVNVPEYPWMKEKKTSRKSSQQGNPFTYKNYFESTYLEYLF